MKRPVVSIIVPIYNAELYLSKCLDSLVSQTVKNIEIILVNDGSSDASSAICERYKKQDSRITLIHQSNSGQTIARQVGFAAARGEYVHFVDSDDWLDPRCAEILYDLAKAHDAEIVTCDSIFHKGQKTIPARQSFDAGVYNKKALLSDIYPRMLYSDRFFYFGIYAAMWNKLFKRDFVAPFITSVNPKVHIGEDGLTTFAAFLAATTVVVSKDELYHYRDDNATSLTRSYAKNQFDSALLLIAELRKIAASNKKTYDISSQIDIYLAYNVRSIILEEFYYRIKKSYKARIRYIRRIVSHPDVQMAIQSIDTSRGFTKEQQRFIDLIKNQQVAQLISSAIHQSLQQRLRHYVRSAVFKNPVLIALYNKRAS